jgi:protein-S-isoprenylcysteine O-methyltransferase Ste14
VPFTQSTALVTGGIYRWTRNPMYLGMMSGLIGLAVLLGTLSAFLPIPLFVWQIRRKFVLPEEAFLEGIFGGRYLEYKARVRRWL